MICSSPLASAGFRMFAASNAPSAPPAPMMVCISSMKRRMFPSFLASAITLFIRSSNSPRYLEPATMPEMSKVTRRLFWMVSGTSPEKMRSARPSTTAVFPTPGSPMRHGLFLVRRESICMTLMISDSRPMTGSSFPLAAISVRSLEYWSSVGVSDCLTGCV